MSDAMDCIRILLELQEQKDSLLKKSLQTCGVCQVKCYVILTFLHRYMLHFCYVETVKFANKNNSLKILKKYAFRLLLPF